MRVWGTLSLSRWLVAGAPQGDRVMPRTPRVLALPGRGRSVLQTRPGHGFVFEEGLEG